MSWANKKPSHKSAGATAEPVPQTPPAGQTCAGCQYWTPTTTECKRYPPQILQPYGGNPDIRFAFPKIAGSDWCGDYVKSGG